MNKKPKTVDEYFVMLPKPARDKLEKLRKIIKATAPKAEEVIAWSMPMFKYQGNLVGYAAFKKHCSLFPMGSELIAEMKKELKKYETTKGSIHFPIGKPLPVTLIKKIVKARIKENETRIKDKRK